MSSFLGIDKFPEINNTIQLFTTFALITLAWVFFRAHTIRDAAYIY